MSAFVVSDYCMSRVIDALRSDPRTYHGMGSWEEDILAEIAAIEGAPAREKLLSKDDGFPTNEAWLRVGKFFFTVNNHAVLERYPDEADVIDTRWKYTPGPCQPLLYRAYTAEQKATGLADIFQNIKAIDCLTYQMNEGKITGHPARKFLLEYRSRITDFIIHTDPLYEAAAWDTPR